MEENCGINKCEERQAEMVGVEQKQVEGKPKQKSDRTLVKKN